MRKFILMVLIATLPLFAGAKEKISIQAKGLVCSFCAQGIEKKFKGIQGVESIKVSLKTKKIDLEVADGTKLSDETIKEIIDGSGYELVKVERLK